jgi:hypothetical protein
MTSILLGNAHAGQGPDQATRRRPNAGTSKRRGQRAPGNDRPYTGNREGSNPRKQADYPTQNAAAERAGSGAFGGLGAGALNELLLPLAVLERHPDLILRKARLLESLDRAFSIALIVKEPHHSSLMAGGLVI